MIVVLAWFYFVSATEMPFKYELSSSRSLCLEPHEAELLDVEIAAASV